MYGWTQRSSPNRASCQLRNRTSWLWIVCREVGGGSPRRKRWARSCCGARLQSPAIALHLPPVRCVLWDMRSAQRSVLFFSSPDPSFEPRQDSAAGPGGGWRSQRADSSAARTPRERHSPAEQKARRGRRRPTDRPPPPPAVRERASVADRWAMRCDAVRCDAMRCAVERATRRHVPRALRNEDARWGWMDGRQSASLARRRLRPRRIPAPGPAW